MHLTWKCARQDNGWICVKSTEVVSDQDEPPKESFNLGGARGELF
jgi:hypothetical protein